MLCNVTLCSAVPRLQEVIEIAKDKLPGYDDKIKMFYEEHIHEDEEIRYILDGTGQQQQQGRAPSMPAGQHVLHLPSGPRVTRVPICDLKQPLT